MDKIFQTILGISLIIFGVGITIDPIFYDRVFDYQFDFSGINIPFGIFLSILGVVFLYLTYKDKFFKRK